MERFYYRALKREHAELMRQKDFEERRRAQATQRLQNWWRMVMAVGLVKSMRERKQQREAEFARIAEQNQDPADLIANLFWTYEVRRGTAEEVRERVSPLRSGNPPPPPPGQVGQTPNISWCTYNPPPFRASFFLFLFFFFMKQSPPPPRGNV